MRRQGCRRIDRALNFSASCAGDGRQTLPTRPCDFNDVTEIFLTQILTSGRVVVTTEGRWDRITAIRVSAVTGMAPIVMSRFDDSRSTLRSSEGFADVSLAKHGLLKLWRDRVIPEPSGRCTTSDRRHCRKCLANWCGELVRHVPVRRHTSGTVVRLVRRRPHPSSGFAKSLRCQPDQLAGAVLDILRRNGDCDGCSSRRSSASS